MENEESVTPDARAELNCPTEKRSRKVSTSSPVFGQRWAELTA